MSATRKPAPSCQKHGMPMTQCEECKEWLCPNCVELGLIESGAPLQPGATQPEHDGVAHETKSRAREWLINGGGGHEDGEDGIRALTLRGEDLVDTLEAYDEWMQERLTTLLERMARLVVQEAAKMCRVAEEVNRCNVTCHAIDRDRILALLTPEKLQQLREAVERG